MTLPEALHAKARELHIDHRHMPAAVCYALWIVQGRNLVEIDEFAFMTRVHACSRTRHDDPAFDKAMRELVTYAINFQG